MNDEAKPLLSNDLPSSIDVAGLNTVSGTSVLEVLHPVTKVPVGIRIECYSGDAPEVRARQRKQFKSVLRARRENREEEALDTVDENELDMLAAATTNWSCNEQEGAIRYEGKFLPFSTANARIVYKNVPIIAEQVRTFIGDRKNFIKG